MSKKGCGYPLLNNRDWLKRKYVVDGLSSKAMGLVVGCSDITVRRALERMGIPRRNNSEAQRGRGIYNELWDKEWVYQKYWVDGLSSCQISAILGCADSAVIKALDRFGLPHRNQSQAQMGERHKYYGKKRSKETIKKMSEAQKNPSEERREKMRETRKRQKFPKHHTKPELIFEEICKEQNLPFHYVGDSSLWIGEGKVLNPDFVECNGKKIVVEIFGDYWHSPLLNSSLRENATLPYREAHYKRYGWNAIFIWESDLKREDAKAYVLNLLKKEGIYSNK